MSMSLAELRDLAAAIKAEVAKAIVGQDAMIDQLLIAMVSEGHVLLEGPPGTAKTFLAQSFSTALGLDFGRIQFTPDLLPGDILGSNLFNFQTSEFTLTRGPIFCELLLADEINRATPRTQSALFEAMAERQVTIDNQTLPLASTFLVIATQNPIESHGAYPLPDAQLDRFAVTLSIGYPSKQDEVQMLAEKVGESRQVVDESPVITIDELQFVQELVNNIEVNEMVRSYLVDLGTATREHSELEIGLSPRGLITWQKMAQAWAFLQNRKFVTPDDIQKVARPVLKLRISGKTQNSDRIIDEVISSVKVPGE